MTAEDRYEGVDALMAVITGTPLPEAARQDPAFMAEHTAAATDVALLREQLRTIGDRLAQRPATPPEPAAPRRRAFKVALGGLAAACAACGAVVLVWLAGHDGTAPHGRPDSSDVTPEGYVACSRLLVEGTVQRVDPVPGARQDRIVLRVERYYKPRDGAHEITFVMDRDVDPRLRPGDRTLIGIPKGEASPDTWSTGADIKTTRAMILKALPGSRTLDCTEPPGPAD